MGCGYKSALHPITIMENKAVKIEKHFHIIGIVVALFVLFFISMFVSDGFGHKDEKS